MSALNTWDLHRDLARKYTLHGAKISQIWRSMEKRNRVLIFGRGGDNIYISSRIPEFFGRGRKEIISTDSRLLDLFRHRAANSLEFQYDKGCSDDELGDHQFIVNVMRTQGLRLPGSLPDSLDGCRMNFNDGEWYGLVVNDVVDDGAASKNASTLVSKHSDHFLPFYSTPVSKQSEVRKTLLVSKLIPLDVGVLVLERQEFSLKMLNILIGHILDYEQERTSLTFDFQRLAKKPDDAAVAALEKLSITGPQPKVDLAHVLGVCQDQRDIQELLLDLMRTEPTALAHAVDSWFMTRPDLLPDEKCVMLALSTYDTISSCVLDAVHHHVKGTAIWQYVFQLLKLLPGTTDKSRRATLLQELSNVCQFEYIRAQDMLRRMVSRIGPMGVANGWFKRSSDGTGKCPVRALLWGDPAELTAVDPQLHYILRLCQPETDAASAVDWIKQLDNLHRTHPKIRDRLDDWVIDAIADLAVIIGCIQSLTKATSMPLPSRKKGRLFVAGVTAVEKEINEIRHMLRLDAYALPTSNLLEPGMAEGALKSLDDFIVEHTGSKLGFLYQDLLTECIDRLTKSNTPQTKSARGDTPLFMETHSSPKLRVEERRAKEKTRPKEPSVYDINPESKAAAADLDDEIKPSDPLKVKASTAKTFQSLFSRSSESRGFILWNDFVKAIADVGFSIVPNWGSVVTFTPPVGFAIQRPFTYHRPHQSRMEGWSVLFLSRRLNRVYGWTEDTFQVD